MPDVSATCSRGSSHTVRERQSARPQRVLIAAQVNGLPRRGIKHLLGDRHSAFGYARDALRATTRICGHVLVTLEARTKDLKRANLLKRLVGDGGFEPPTPAV